MTYMAGCKAPDDPVERMANLQRVVAASDIGIGALGITRKADKCKWSAMCWDGEGVLIPVEGPLTTTVFKESSDEGWGVSSEPMEMDYIPPHKAVRDLGLRRSMLGCPGENIEALPEDRMGKVAAVTRRRLTPEALRYVSNTVIRSAAMHGEKYAILDEKKLQKVEEPLRRAFIEAAKMVRSMPIWIMTGPRELGGTWDDWCQTLRVRQLELFAAELHCPIMRPYALAAATRLAEATGVRDGAYGSEAHKRLGGAADTWLGELVAWAVTKHMTVSMPISPDMVQSPAVGDVNVRDHVENHWRPTGGTREVRIKREEVLEQLAKDNKTWLSDVAAKRTSGAVVAWTLGEPAARNARGSVEEWKSSVEQSLMTGRGKWRWTEGGLRDRLRGAKGKMLSVEEGGSRRMIIMEGEWVPPHDSDEAHWVRGTEYPAPPPQRYPTSSARTYEPAGVRGWHEVTPAAEAVPDIGE